MSVAAIERKLALSTGWVIGFAAVFLLFIVAAVAAFFMFRELGAARVQVEQAYQTLHAAEVLVSEIKDAETGQRGYLLTGEAAYLNPYHAAVASLPQRVATLRALVDGRPTELAQIERIEDLCRRKLNEVDETIRLARSGRRDAAIQVVQSGAGRALMDEIRVAAMAFSGSEGDGLSVRNERVARIRWMTWGVIVVLSALGVVSAAGVWFANADLARRRARLSGEVRARQAAQGTLAEAEERYRTTLTSIGDGVIATDDRSRVTFMNAVAESLTGWRAADATGRPIGEVFHIVDEATRLAAENPIERALREGRTVGLEEHSILVARDGRERAIDDSAAPIFCKEGQLVGGVLVFRDVTERRQVDRRLHESEARKTAMFESALDCIISMDAEGKIIEFNAAAESTFGWPRADVLGRDLAELIIPPEDRERHRQGLARYLATGVGSVLNQRLEFAARRADGAEFPVELTVTRVPVEGPAQFTAYLRDITERRRAEQALQDSERRFREMINALPAAVYTTDAEGHITHFNPATVEYSGRTPVVGTDRWCVSWKLCNADGTPLPHEECPMAIALREGREIRGETIIAEQPDGTRRWLEVYPTPLRDAAGGVVGGINMLVDITARRAAEQALRESEERLRLAQGIARIGTFDWNMQSGVIRWTPELESMHGLKPGEFPGTQQRWAEMVHPDDRVEALRRVEAAMQDGRFEGEWRVVWPDGTLRWLAGRAWVFKDGKGKPLSVIGVNIDITERKRLENELRQVAADLSEVDRRKDAFLATLAHELRTPLAPLRNMLELMKRAEGAGDTLRQAREVMERQLNQLTRLIDDLLDLSRVSRGRIELRRAKVELASAVRDAVEAATPALEAAHHQLTVTLPPEPIYLHADAVRLAQVFGNLLNNACKYTEPDGKGRISITATRRGGNVLVSVRDNGVGIPPDMLDGVFEMFTQIDPSLERSHGGLGIGLSLVKELVELHGGDVRAHSAGLGKGTEMVVRLPVLAAALQESAPSPPQEFARIAPRRILVVDDNHDAAASLAALLELVGHKTRLAGDGVEAVQIAAAERPDVALFDIGLPKLNGYAAARQIRAQAWGQSMVLVALTGWGQDADRQKSSAAGFDGHLVKPVDFDALCKLLDELCLRRGEVTGANQATF